jgi:GT2 family glycosyltransferase
MNRELPLTRERISVIIPTFNRDRYIGHTIQNVLDQNVPDLELIIVDDGSTDNTAKICQEFGGRIQYIFQENSGPSAARNAGIAQSTGNWIVFLDSDDLLAPGAIHSHLEFVNRTGALMSVVRHRIIDDSASSRIDHSRPSFWILFTDNLDVHLCYRNIAPTSAFFMHRSVVLDTGGFDTSMDVCEDYSFFLQSLEKGFTPRYNPDGLVYYRHHSSSLSRNVLKMVLHDEIMHHRVSAMLDRMPGFLEGRRMEALLAAGAGCLLTAAHMQHHGMIDKSMELIDLALMNLRESCRTSVAQAKKFKVLSHLFLRRILHHREIIPEVPFNKAEELQIVVADIGKGLGHHTSKVGKAGDFLKASWGLTPELREERKELRGYLLSAIYRQVSRFGLRKSS